jgi:hypothetical protein
MTFSGGRRNMESVAPPGLGVLFAVVAGAHAPAYSLPPLRGSLTQQSTMSECSIFRMTLTVTA